MVDSKQYQNYDQPEQQQEENMASSWSLAAIRSSPPIKATKFNNFNIRVDGDYGLWACDITGIAITKDNRRILVDFFQKKVKLFSRDMKFLFALSLPYEPFGIAVVNDNTAIVTNITNILFVLNISDIQMLIERKVNLDFDVLGISACEDRLVVTCPHTEPPSVKLIDLTGRVYWSATTDQQGEQLFKLPQYVCCHGTGEAVIVLVSDREKDTLSLINATTGEVKFQRHLMGKGGRRGVTTDAVGNVFVCYRAVNQVTVLLGGLVEERVLLKEKDGLRNDPSSIVYDQTERHLIIAYRNNNNIDCFKLS